MSRHTAPRVGTLRDLIAGRRTLWLNCLSCRRHVQLDPLALAVAHGESLPIQTLLDRSRCSVCGSREVDLIAPNDGVGPGGMPVDG